MSQIVSVLYERKRGDFAEEKSMCYRVNETSVINGVAELNSAAPGVFQRF